jgi:sn-glycerol 3-phosphate transport system permease protein
MVNQDIGGSAAQSVVLMLGVIALTALQFRFLGRRREV